MKTVRDVRIVAVLFLITGLAAVVRLIQTRALESIPGLLALPTAIGLFRWSNAWRIVAVATLWIALATFVVVCGIALTQGDVLVETAWSRSPAVVAAIALVSLALMLWQLRVLTRPDVRRSFELGDPAA